MFPNPDVVPNLDKVIDFRPVLRSPFRPEPRDQSWEITARWPLGRIAMRQGAFQPQPRLLVAALLKLRLGLFQRSTHDRSASSDR